MRTYAPKPGDIKRAWPVIDAADVRSEDGEGALVRAGRIVDEIEARLVGARVDEPDAELIPGTPLLRRGEVRPEDVRAHVADLAARGFKASSAARKLSAVRQFHKFLYSDAVRNDDPTAAVDSPRRGRALPKTLSTADIEALIAAAADAGPEPTARARLASARPSSLVRPSRRRVPSSRAPS